MSESESASYDEYSSEEETEETDQSETSEKNNKQETPSPQKKESTAQSDSDSDDSDDDSSDESEQSDTYTASEDQKEKPESKEEQSPPKSTNDEQATNKNAPAPKKESPENESSDYSDSDESSSPEDSDESSSPEKKPSPSPSKGDIPPPNKTPPPSKTPPPPPARKPSSLAEEPKKSSSTEKTQNSESYDYSESDNDSEKPKAESKKSAKSSSVQKNKDSEYDYSYTNSEESKEEPKKSKKSSSTKKDSKSEKPEKVATKSVSNASAEKTSQTTRKSTTTNSVDLTQPPDFSVPPEVLEEASHKKVDRYGWIQAKEPSSKEKKLLEQELAKEEERSKKWKKMMTKKKWPYYKTRRGFRVVKERTIKGIPNDIRPKAWVLLLDDPDNRKPNRGTVQEFFDQGTPAVEHTIRVDIPRTMPNVPEFLKTETREKLYRILRAYSNASGGGGYFQGMGFHAAIYLLYIKDEEKAFWCLYNLMMGDKHKVKDLFENEFAGLKVMNQVWEVLLEKKFKHVYTKLKDLMVDPMIYTPSWFLCAFLDLDFPPVLRLRIIDRLIVFGSRQLLSLALAIIDLNQATLSARNAQMDTVLPLLQNPTTADTMKDWREIVKKWDHHYLSKKDYSALFKKAGLKEIP